MKRVRSLAVWVVAALLATAFPAVSDAPLAVVPPGFAKFSLTDIKAALVAPANWNLRTSQRGAVQVFELGPLDASGAPTETRITVNVHRDVPRACGLPPSVVASEALVTLGRKHGDVDISQNSAGVLSVNRAILSDPGAPEELRMQVLFIANDRTGTLYTLVYETPARLWEQNRRAMDTLMANLIFDDEI